MSQASTPFVAGQSYFIGKPCVVKLSPGQWVSVNTKGMVNVEDLLKFKDDDIDNVITNLRRPQDVWHATREAVVGLQKLLPIPMQYRLCFFKPRFLHVPEMLHGLRMSLLWYVVCYW